MPETNAEIVQQATQTTQTIEPQKLSTQPLYTKPPSKPMDIEASIFTIFDSCIPGGMFNAPAKTKVQ